VLPTRMDVTAAGSVTPTRPTLATASARPVFLDATGRRGRWLNWAGRVFAMLVVGYLLVVLSVLSGPPALTTAALPAVPAQPTLLPAAFVQPGAADVTSARLILDFRGGGDPATRPPRPPARTAQPARLAGPDRLLAPAAAGTGGHAASQP
jgi:hypothetical protein